MHFASPRIILTSTDDEGEVALCPEMRVKSAFEHQFAAKRIPAWRVAHCRIGNVKGILEITGRMLLRDEESIEIPETSLDISIRRHLLEAHLEKDVSKLLSHLVEWMEGTSLCRRTFGFEVVWLQLYSLPCPRREHLGGEVRLLLHKLGREFGSFGYFE